MKKQILTLFIVCLLMTLFIENNTAKVGDPSPPNQPPNGPGGSDYKHNKVKISRYKWGARQFWIFEPDDPKPEKAPLIVFNHGWTAMFPVFYKEWINHIVKKGNIVVYPRYQLGIYFGFKNFYSNALQAVKDAIKELENEAKEILDEINRCIRDNATKAQDQEEYIRKYNALVEMYEGIRRSIEDVENERFERLVKKDRIEEFMKVLRN
ncbi:MAG: hypothetical protein QHH15_02575, partial [Candidatus Thermoplasmatota archaeon]|nr:hypothetical protein [Candidatus Thermoplasmatota archaeon]